MQHGGLGLFYQFSGTQKIESNILLALKILKFVSVIVGIGLLS